MSGKGWKTPTRVRYTISIGKLPGYQNYMEALDHLKDGPVKVVKPADKKK
jgi:hypothetical protein